MDIENRLRKLESDYRHALSAAVAAKSRLLAIENNLRKLTGTSAIDFTSTPLVRPPRTKKPAASKGGAR